MHNDLPQSGALIIKNTGDLPKLHTYNLARKLSNLLQQAEAFSWKGSKAKAHCTH